MIRVAVTIATRLGALAAVTTTAAVATWPLSWGVDRVVEAYTDAPAPQLWQQWAQSLQTATADEVTIGLLNGLAIAVLLWLAVLVGDRVGNLAERLDGDRY